MGFECIFGIGWRVCKRPVDPTRVLRMNYNRNPLSFYDQNCCSCVVFGSGLAGGPFTNPRRAYHAEILWTTGVC